MNNLDLERICKLAVEKGLTRSYLESATNVPQSCQSRNIPHCIVMSAPAGSGLHSHIWPSLRLPLCLATISAQIRKKAHHTHIHKHQWHAV